MRTKFALLLILIISVNIPSSIFAQNKTLGPGSCGLGQNNCHFNDNEWWKNDDHKFTVQSIYDALPQYEQMAERAGVGAANLFKGNNKCMGCHGTVISGKEANEVDNGVSCESCHGPGSGYKDIHSEGDAGAGKNRVGYSKGLSAGMREMAKLDVRAKTCVGCHFINDEKLLRAGHPSGNTFNYVKGIRSVSQHWDRQPGSEDTDNGPFKKAVSDRGPLPNVTPVVVANTGPSAPRPPAPPPNISVDPYFPTKAPKKLDLEPFPQVPDTASFEEILRIVKLRLELLYKQIGR